MSGEQVSLHENLNEFFHGVLDDVLRSRERPPSPPIQSYLVGVLVDSTRSEDAPLAGDAPWAVRLQAALSAEPSRRFEELRGFGDRALLLHGFFHERVGRSAPDDRYVSSLGAHAYRAASALLHGPRENVAFDVLGQMAADFERLAAILRDVAATLLSHTAHRAEQLVRLCEQWLSGGSAHVAGLLRARGVQLDQARLLLH